MRLKVMDRQMLLALNDSSIKAGHKHALAHAQTAPTAEGRYWVSSHLERNGGGEAEVCACVVLDLQKTLAAWLDMTKEAFDAIPYREVDLIEWETVVCVGDIPPLPH
ncbi:MAG: hypothetical protein HY681_13890 [Chloroflexi bacterium]|nr:hypothetical protein [Chloroflexota bacterium]